MLWEGYGARAMAEGSGGRKEEWERLVMRGGEGGLAMNMSELRGEDATGSDGGAITIRKNAGENVICFGSIPAVLDVAGSDGRRVEGIERRREREGAGNLRMDQPLREGSGGGARRKHQQVEKGKDVRSDRSLEKGCYANGVNGTGEVQGEEVSWSWRERGEREKEAMGSQKSVDEMATTEALSSNVSTADNDRSPSISDVGAVNVKAGACGVLSSAEEGSMYSNSVHEVNGSPSGEAQCEALDNGREQPGSVEIDSVGSELADVDYGQSGSSAEDESRNGASQMQKIPRPLPPVLSSVDERSMRLSWVGCSMAVSYELDYACNEVPMASKKVLNSVPVEGDVKWTPILCGEGLSCKVCNFCTSLFKPRSVS